MFLLLVFVWFALYVIWYSLKIRRTRLYEVYCEYPPCFKELPFIGANYHFLIHTPEAAMKKIMDMGFNTINLGGISRIYGYKAYYLVMTDAPDIGEILTKCLNKDRYLYRFMQFVAGNASAFESESSISKVRRRVMMPSFSPKMMASYISCIWQESVSLTEELKPFVGNGPFQAGAYLGAYCINSVIRASDTQEMRKEVCTLQFLKDIHRCFRLIFDRGVTFWMHYDSLYSWSSNYKDTKKLKSVFQHCTTLMYKMRKDKLLKSCTSNVTSDQPADIDGEKILKRGLIDDLVLSELPENEVLEEIIVMLGASDECMPAVGFALMLLGQYPAVQDKVYEELQSIFGDSDRPADKEDLANMRYLDLVIKETIRLFPPVPLIIRRAQKEVKLSSGRIIPYRSGIIVPIIALHRSPKYWGADAEHFDPDRFLPERLVGVPDTAYIPFSYGPRSCIGYKFGSYTVKMALCALLRKYKVVGEPAAGPVPNIQCKFEVNLKSVNNFTIELINRK